MKMPIRAAVVGLLTLLANPSAGHEYTLGEISVDHPHIMETPPTAKTAAGYMTIANHADEADRLIEVRADFPSVELHVSEVDAAGVARMRALEAIDIPAGGSVTLAPRGMHVMFLDLAAPLRDGDRIEATLVFERAGAVPIVFEVEPRAAGGMGADHGGAAMTH